MATTTELPPRAEPLAANDPAPDFTLLDQNRNEWTLSDALTRGDVALCFYPMDFSPVCSTEMKCVNDEFDRWKNKGIQVVGISCDSFFTHQAWAESIGLKQALLADMHRAVSKAYGFYWPDLNVSGRGTVLVGKGDDGTPVVRWVQEREIKDAMNIDDLLSQLA
ncbi:MAG: redoxin domain-containing protein [Phycisphaerales bacterium JB060]